MTQLLRPYSISALLLAAGLAFFGCGGNNNGVLTASGTIETTEVDLAPKSPGQLIALRVDEGSAVKAGDTIGIIDTTTYAINYRQAIAAMSQADAMMREQEHGSRNEDIEQAAAVAEQAKANFEDAKTNFGRIKDLYAANAATKKQFDDAQSQLDETQAALNAAHESFEKFKTGSRVEDIDAARAHFDQLKQQADLALNSSAIATSCRS